MISRTRQTVAHRRVPEPPQAEGRGSEAAAWAKVDAYGGAAARADPIGPFTPLPSLSAAGLAGPVPPVTWQNPILPVSAPDPGVLKDGDDYYAVATGGDKEGAFIIRHSTDLVHWEKVGDIFPNGKGPRWASGSFWAPEIHKVGERFVAYFTAKDAQSGKLCVGAAVADTPQGPFVDVGQPLVQKPGMGVIDPNFFRDPQTGKQYLIWKDDGNGATPASATPLWIQELSADGLTRLGEPKALLRNDLPWEGNLVEGPWMTYHDGFYYLFYSANAYYDARYAVGVARSRSPWGPFEKKGPPILASNEAFTGPGHGSVVQGPDGNDYFVYHAWAAGKENQQPGRRMMLDVLHWGVDGWPVINDGTPSSGPMSSAP